MYSIVSIRGNKLESISTPNQRSAYRVFMALVREGYIVRMWKAEKGVNSPILVL